MTGRRAPKLLSHPAFRAVMAVLSVWCMAPGGCGGGSSSSPSGVSASPSPTPAVTTGTFLSESDVNTIMLQAVNEATARGKPATIVVVDRVGNILAATQMAGAPPVGTVTTFRGIPTGSGLEGAPVPTQYEAIAKALTAAYFSSNQNAFSSRTGGQIVQEHFEPGVAGNPSGPLFGVQFSQLECSDVARIASAVPGTTNAGSHRSPLGFGADSGGLPLYKNGLEVGAIGVMSRNTYSVDSSPPNAPLVIEDDEVIALAGTQGYTAPPTITADNIAIGGLSLRFTFANTSDFAAPISSAGTFTPLVIPGYYAGPAAGHTAVAGTTFGALDGSSGFVPDGTFGPVLYPGTVAPIYVYTDGLGNVRFPPTAGLSGGSGQPITAAEATGLVVTALNLAASTRSAIRVPTNTPAQFTVTVVDYDGNILASARQGDTLVDSADVTPQKARSAIFLSRPDTAATISALTGAPSGLPGFKSPNSPDGTFAYYIKQAQQNQFLGPAAFANGTAFSTTGAGDIARPFYPDGIDGSPAGTTSPSSFSPPGPLSLPYRNPLTNAGTADWSIFNTGLQLDLVINDIIAGISTDASFAATPPAAGCGTRNGPTSLTAASGGKTRLPNGLETFFGAFPIYRGSTLVGAISGSGDGGQQDDLIPFLALQNGPATVNQAPQGIRDDQLNIQGVRLRYSSCPTTPFLNSSVQNPC
jgi:uncharacterized protein GlcG (DUF336 family)